MTVRWQMDRKDTGKKQESKQRTTNNKEMGEELKRVKQRMTGVRELTERKQSKPRLTEDNRQ